MTWFGMKNGTFLLIAILCTSTAHAQLGSNEARARQHFNAGQKLVAQDRFSDAFDQFEAGYQLSHRPLFLFNMGECARRMRDPNRARENYERYLREEPRGTLAAKARERVAELVPTATPLAPVEPAGHTQDVPVPKPVPISSSGTLRAQLTPNPLPIVAPVATSAGRSFDSATTKSTMGRLGLSAIVVAAGAAAVAVTGVGLVASVETDAKALESKCQQMSCNVNNLFTRRYAGEALLGIAGAAAIADVALWGLDARKRHATTRASLRLTIGGAAMVGGF